MRVDKNLLKLRVSMALLQAKAPYDGAVGGVYLDRAWHKGADYMAEQCVRLVDELDDKTID
ncbi:MAG: hypothetical protein AAFU56_00885 [Pseudomonadota bacterium]